MLTDRNGLPLHVLASAANTHDSRLFEFVLETNPSVRGRRGRPGRPRRRPEKPHADKGYDYPRCRRYLQQRGIKIRIARRGIKDENHLGRHRGVVERTTSRVLRFERLRLALRSHRGYVAASVAAGRHAHQPPPTAPGDEVVRPKVTEFFLAS